MTTVRVSRGSAYYRQGPGGQMVHVSGARAHSRTVKGRDRLTGTVTPRHRRTRLRVKAKRRAVKWARRRWAARAKRRGQ